MAYHVLNNNARNQGSEGDENLPELTRCPNYRLERPSDKQQSPSSIFGKALRVVVNVVHCLTGSDSSGSEDTSPYTGTPAPRRSERYPFTVDRVGYIAQGRPGMEIPRGFTRCEPERPSLPEPVRLGDGAYSHRWHRSHIERHSPVSYNSMHIATGKSQDFVQEDVPAAVERWQWQVTGYYPGPDQQELYHRLEMVQREREEPERELREEEDGEFYMHTA